MLAVASNNTVARDRGSISMLAGIAGTTGAVLAARLGTAEWTPSPTEPEQPPVDGVLADTQLIRALSPHTANRGAQRIIHQSLRAAA